jgi:hypothetical protein
MKPAVGIRINKNGAEQARKCDTTWWRFELSHEYQLYLEKRYDRYESPYIADLSAALVDTNGRSAGKFTGEIIEAFDINFNGESLFWQCDAHSEHVCNVYESLLLEGMPLSEFADDPDCGLLHLAKLEIDVSHRGKGLGLEVCAGVMTAFADSCGYTVMKPFPLQWVGKVNADQRKEKRMQRDRKKLIDYYSPLGFNQASAESEYWIHRMPRPLEFPSISIPRISRIRKKEFPDILQSEN